MNYRLLGLLSLGHLVNDMNQGALPALLPFLIAEHNLSYGAAAGIMFAFTITSTVIQPVLGHLADRCNQGWLIPAGVVMASGGLAVSGLVPGYIPVIIAVIVSGTGSAAFHPEAARHVDLYGGDKKATAMSIFGVGGNLGFSLGPLLMTGSLLCFGLDGTMIMVFPAGIVAFLFMTQFRQLKSRDSNVKPLQAATASRDDWSAFFWLTITIIGKSVIFYALLTFIPLYWTRELGQTTLAGGVALSLFSFAGIFGNLLGGRLADRYGYKAVVVAGCTLLVPVIPAFVLTESVFIALILVIAAGVLLLMTYGPTVVMGQQYLPNHVGLSSGMTLGVAYSVGGAVTPFLGNVADMHGVGAALACIAVTPLLMMAVSFTLKS